MHYSEFHLSAPNGLRLFGRQWLPAQAAEIRAVVCLIHGIGDHSGRYQELVSYLVNRHFAVLAIDQMGHGQSEGRRGHARRYDDLLDNVALLLRKAQTDYSGLPIFLYGHSWGGNQVINFALRRQSVLQGVIATSPWLRLGFTPPRWKVGLGQLMRWVYPSLSQPSGLIADHISRDKAVVEAYRRDPLVHSQITASMFVHSHAAGLWALKHADEFPLPLQLIHGSQDKLTSPEGSQEFAAKRKDKVSFRLFEGMYHETHHEIGKEEVFRTIGEWLERQLKNAPGH